MNAKIPSNIWFSPSDRWILDQLSAELGVSRNEVLRLTLRYYAVSGPRHVVPQELTDQINEAYPDLETEPQRKEAV